MLESWKGNRQNILWKCSKLPHNKMGLVSTVLTSNLIFYVYSFVISHLTFYVIHIYFFLYYFNQKLNIFFLNIMIRLHRLNA